MYKVSKNEIKSKAQNKEVNSDTIEKGKIPTLSEVVMNNKSESTSNLSVSRMGSFRKKNETSNSNSNKEINDRGNTDGILHETVEIVKDLPALHLEHCKL